MRKTVTPCCAFCRREGAEITATGTFPGIGLGEELTMVGCWVMHPSYGEQFSAERFERRLPTTVRGIADYLSSGLIRGIGPRLGHASPRNSARIPSM